MSSTRRFSSAYLALQVTGALAATKYFCQLAVWANSLLSSGLGATYAAAERWISAGAVPRPLTRLT